MKRLLLLRHAKSSWRDQSLVDFDRPLNARGRKAAPLMGRYSAAHDLVPDRVLCSSAVRAQETWDRVGGALGLEKSAEEPEVKLYRSLYLASPGRMLEIIQRQPPALSCLLLIAHNPGLENLTLRLAGRDSDRAALMRAGEKFPTAALAELLHDGKTWTELAPGSARLTRFVIPADLN